ncbi:MAG: hypothetical protein K2J63_06935, partial [Muribaculaceae bacterium]|nr:hypothetical protein [Muribaculaceae bacterium]
MMKLLLSCIPILMVVISAIPAYGSSVSEDNTQSLTLILPDHFYLVDSQQGLCFANAQGQGELVSLENTIKSLKDLSEAFNIADEYFPLLKSEIPEAYKYIDARYDECVSYMVPVMDQINMAERKLNDLLAKLAVVHQLIDEQLYNSSTTISKINSTHATKSGNDFNVAESGATALQIADMAIWYKELEAEIELAKKNEEYLMQLVHDWVEAETDDMVDLYTNQTMELWRLASQDMTQAEADNALDQWEILADKVKELYNRIDSIKSDFPSQN